MTWTVIQSDALTFARSLETGCASLTMFSPPYEDARTYGIDFKLKGQAWVDWLAPIIVELARVTNGLVLCNAAGKVKQFRYTPVIEWLVADLTRQHGLVCGPAPYVFSRVGIPGSGGPHYHRRDWEPVYAFARPEVLPLAWSDNTAMGHPPKWAPGGEMSHRNQWGSSGNGCSERERRKNGERPKQKKHPSHKVSTKRLYTRNKNGTREEHEQYTPPPIANPGNLVERTYTAKEVAELLAAEQSNLRRLKVGGGLMGNALCHENEAPYPEKLVEFFVRSFAPPNGLVLDPFTGSGTTGAVSVRWCRRFLGCDLRQGQVDIACKRIAGETPLTLLESHEA